MFLLGFRNFGINRFVGEPDDPKSNNNVLKEEYLAVNNADDTLEPSISMKSLTSLPKPQLSNFSVLSLLARKSPDNEKEKQFLEENCSQKEIHFPSGGEDVSEEKDELDPLDQAQSPQVGK